MEEPNRNWGGKRKGAGRKPASSVPRKTHSVFVNDEEMKLVRDFIAILKKDPQRAKKLLSK